MMRPRWTGIDLRELAEDEIVVLRRNPDAGIADLHEQLRRSGTRRPHRAEPDAPTGGCEIDGVAEQVPDDVGDLLAVRHDGRERGIDLDDELQLLACDQRLVERAHLT